MMLKKNLNTYKYTVAIMLPLTIVTIIMLVAAPQNILAEAMPDATAVAAETVYLPQEPPGSDQQTGTADTAQSGAGESAATDAPISAGNTAVAGIASTPVTSEAPATTPPTIMNKTPANGSVVSPMSAIGYDFTAPAGVEPSAVHIMLDNVCTRLLSGTTVVTSGNILFTPTAPLTDGPHNLRAMVCDNLLHCSMSNWSIIVDATAPIAADNSPTGTINVPAPTISASLSDGTGSGVNASGVTVSLDGSNITSGCAITAASVICNPGALLDGSHSVSIDIPDNVGNHGTSSWSFDINTGAIGVTGQKPTGGSWLRTATPQIGASFQAVGTAVIQTGDVTIVVDGTNVTSDSTVDADGVLYLPGLLPEGSHSVRVTARDDANHSGLSEWDFNTDTVAPAIAKDAPGGNISGGLPSFTAHYSDSGSGINLTSVRMNIDGDDATSSAAIGAGDITFTPHERLLAGAHNVQVSLSDNAGNSQTSVWNINVPAVEDQSRLPASSPSTSTAIRLIEYWQSYSPMTLGSAGRGWVISGFTASPNSYFLPWYDSQSVGGSGKNELVIANRGGGEAFVSIFVAGQEKWHGSLAEGAKEIMELAGTVGGPVKIICPTSQPLDVLLRTTNGSSISEYKAIAGEDLEPVWFLPWYVPRTEGPTSSNLIIGNAGDKEAAVDVFLGDPSLPESLKGHYSIQAGAAATMELKDDESGLFRVISTNGQPLIVGAQTRTGEAVTQLAAAGLSRLDSRYSFGSYDSGPGSGVQGDWLLLGNGNEDEIRIEVSIGDRRLSDPENPENDFFLLPGGGARELQLPEKEGSAVEAVCTNCSFGQGFVAIHRLIKNQSMNEAMGRS